MNRALASGPRPQVRVRDYTRTMTGESGRPLHVWPLRIERRREDGVLVLDLKGRIGATSSPTLRAVLDKVLDEGDRRLVVDLTNVDYISSTGLVTLDAIGSRLTASQGCLVLCGLTDAVRIAFDLAGVGSPVLVERDVPSAIKVALSVWP